MGVYPLVDLILKSKTVNVNARDRYGGTALMLVRTHPIAKQLLAHPGIEVNIVDNRGQTALMR